MPKLQSLEAYGALSEPATLTFQRLLPGPVDRIWAYLTESDLRKKWLAAGIMQPKAGSSVELVWRNEELATQPSKRPAGHDEEHRLTCEILAYEPQRKLAISWGRSEGVTFDLEPVGDKVLLTVTHRRLPDRETLLKVGAGWHMHLDVLATHLAGETGEAFWPGWVRLRAEYDKRLPA